MRVHERHLRHCLTFSPLGLWRLIVSLLSSSPFIIKSLTSKDFLDFWVITSSLWSVWQFGLLLFKLIGIGLAGEGLKWLEASSAIGGETLTDWADDMCRGGVRRSKSMQAFWGNGGLEKSNGKAGGCAVLVENMSGRPWYGAKPGGKNAGGPCRNIRKGFGGGGVVIVFVSWDTCWCCCCGWPPELVESQKRLCLDSDVTVLKLCPHFVHLICIRQSACIRLWRHKFENCVYALKQTSHWNGLTEEWMCVCCLRPDDVAKVLPHSAQAWLRAPTWCERMWRWRFDGSVKTW